MPTPVQTSGSLVTALRVDAVLVTVAGIVLAIAASVLERTLAIDAVFLRGVGLLLLPWAAFVGWSGMHLPRSRIAAWMVVTGNVSWVLASVCALSLRALEPNSLGIALILAQASLVAVLAGWQAAALRGTRP